MIRRDFLRAAGVALPQVGRLLAAPDNWRTFEVKTRVVILKADGATRVWLPAALLTKTPFQQTLSNEFTVEGGTARIVEGKTDALGIIAAEFPAGVKPVLTLTSRVSTRDYGIDLSAP